ncbi:hypothetical protein AX16_001561 [Volvariella volvacea WC 439]|nr:hypothetical protein AX16_001561 [Volvariella volvacea WC 439]
MAQSWQTLPAEMKAAVINVLEIEDVRVFSRVNRDAYSICIPFLFKNVVLKDMAALDQFLSVVPRDYCHYIETLSISTEFPSATSSQDERTDAVVAILLASRRLISLDLRIGGCLGKNVITPFSCLPHLKRLAIYNCNDETVYPLSERLAVSIAASLPSLEELTLDRISRSRMHAPELEGVYPFVPLVIGDEDVPDHAVLGSELFLPSLLRIPTLQKLSIRDTHLGDPRWATTPIACHLQVVDLGSCYHESEESNRICTERIMSAVGRTVHEFSLATSVTDSVFAKPLITPLPRLRKLHISPFFPVDSVVDTMSTLAGSPIESVSMQCFEDDVLDVCLALEDFLSLKVEKGQEFYQNLARIDVTVAANEDVEATLEEKEERKQATEKLQEFCRDLRLSSAVIENASGITSRGASRSASVMEFRPEECPDCF